MSERDFLRLIGLVALIMLVLCLMNAIGIK